MFISFEGVDGCGKSTLLNNIAKQLESEGKEVVITSDLNHGYGKVIKNEILMRKENNDLTLKDELKLIESARTDNFQNRIYPSLLQGKIVLCDRYTDSTYVYQNKILNGAASLFHPWHLVWLYKTARKVKTVYIEIDAKSVIDRLHARRENDIIDSFDEEVINTYIERFHDLIQFHSERFVVVNGKLDPETLTKQTYRKLFT